MRLLALAVLATCLLQATPTRAQTGTPVVVELFTSQGCSSCPPADRLLQELAARPDVIALALHVDYWDYIGWKDIFADPAHTDRQRGYAHMGGRNMVYTPQMIINGQDDVVGARSMELADLITKHRGVPATVAVQARRSGSSVTIHVAPAGSVPVKGPLMVQLVQFTPLSHVQITRGENSGRSLDYVNVVDRLVLVGHWNGAEAADLTANLVGDQPAVVLVQSDGPGPILGAARVD